MKKLLTIFLSIISLTLMAQVPQGVGYQGVATDANGIELVNQSISIRASVLSGSATGTVEWEETHATSTDTFGLFTLTIGQGTNTTNGAQTSFADISWGTNTHYLKIEMDVTGGSNYSFMGTNQMMSVPYALYAESANINYDSIATILSSDSSFTNVFGSSCTSFDPPQTTFNWTFNLNSYTTHFQEALEDGFFGGQMNCGSQYQGVFEVWDDTTSNSYIYNYNISNGVSTFLIPIKKGQFFRKSGTCINVNFFIPLVCEGSSSSSLDSTTIANMIAGAGGGCNFKYPDGLDGEPISWGCYPQGDYTVPPNKTLYITNAKGNYNEKLKINNGVLNLEILRGANHGGNSDFSLGNPIVVGSGEIVNGDMAFNGYLVDENYFAGCGGGGNSSNSGTGNMVVSTFGDTLTMNGQSIIVPGISYQNTPSSIFGSVTDINGNTYQTVTIGTQEWMMEDLRVKNFSNGDPLTLQTNNNTCNVPAYREPYTGRIYYNGIAILDSRNVCPSGWHVPTKSDYELLLDVFGYYDPMSQKWIESGAALKSITSTSWSDPYTANNYSHLNFEGFGMMYCSSNSVYNSDQAVIWTSTEPASPSNNQTYYLSLLGTSRDASFSMHYGYPSTYLNSCRCVKD